MNDTSLEIVCQRCGLDDDHRHETPNDCVESFKRQIMALAEMAEKKQVMRLGLRLGELVEKVGKSR